MQQKCKGSAAEMPHIQLPPDGKGQQQEQQQEQQQHVHNPWQGKCRYFMIGTCWKGNSCKFSHGGQNTLLLSMHECFFLFLMQLLGRSTSDRAGTF